MAKKSFFETVLRTAGMLAMVPVFGMALAGCDDGSTDSDDSYEYYPPELPETVGENVLGDKKYEDSYLKVVFDNDGTYELSEDEDGAESDKSMELSEKGDYSWNTTAKTVTLAPKEVASPNGGMIDFAATKALLQEHPDYLTDGHGVTSTVNELLAEIFGLTKYEYELNDTSVTKLTDITLAYSIQVNNQASAARAVSAGDTVELHIINFEYCEDANTRALILIANNDRDMGSRGGKLNNADWFSTEADLRVENDVNNGPYSGFYMKIDKLKVNSNEYPFPENNGVFSGHPTSIWTDQYVGGVPTYPDNFSGIRITDDTVSLKTVLTVEPGIIGTQNSEGYDNQGLATDPYQYIKVEGLVNE